MNADFIQETTHSPSLKHWEGKNLKGVTKTEILVIDTNTGYLPIFPNKVDSIQNPVMHLIGF